MRRGACPSLDAPMRTGDGLLARLRVVGGRLTPGQLAKIAEIAGQFGNGQIEITTRGNLQVRGLSDATAADFARAIEAVVGIERGLVIECPPLAGDDPAGLADPRALALTLKRQVDERLLNEKLGPKVTVVIDGGETIGLGALGADIRLEAIDAAHWQLSVGNHAIGSTGTDDAVNAVVTVLELIAARGVSARGRDLTPDDVRAAVGECLGNRMIATSAPGRSVGRFATRSGSALGIGLPFGASDWQALVALAATATAHGVDEFRLAPHHGLLALGGDIDAWAEDAKALEFVTAPDDARRSISACIGTEGCASGQISARRVAAELARRHDAVLDGSISLHISGCSKGCAHPRPATLAIVGGADDCALVSNGRAGDTPVARSARSRLERSIDRLAAGIAAKRQSGDTTAAVLARLGATELAGLFRQE